MNRGFTVVEVLVTLVVIGIILGLGTVGLRSTLANGRDAERKADVETIARGLEQRYNNGNSMAALPPAGTYWPDPNRRGKGNYPGVNEFIHTQGDTRASFTPTMVYGGYIPQNLPGASLAAMTTPSGHEVGQVCVYACQPAGNDAQLLSIYGGDAANPQDKYIYEAVNGNGGIESNGYAVAFNLYWISEVDRTPYKGINGLKVIKSKHR